MHTSYSNQYEDNNNLDFSSVSQMESIFTFMFYKIASLSEINRNAIINANEQSENADILWSTQVHTETDCVAGIPLQFSDSKPRAKFHCCFILLTNPHVLNVKCSKF